MGPPVFKTGGAAPGVARWVRLPCAPANGSRRSTLPDRERVPEANEGAAGTLVEFPSDDAILCGRLFLPPGGAAGPAVVMTHGLSATITGMVAERYAMVIADAGVAALLVEHRGFGLSGGEPRRVLNRWRQMRDFQHGLDFLGAVPGVDPERMGIWGDSMSGGVALAVAAFDERVRAVVVQVPACGSEAPASVARGEFATLRDLYRTGAWRELPSATGPPIAVVSADRSTMPSILEPITAFRWFMAYGGRPDTGWQNEASTEQVHLPVPYHVGSCVPHLRVPSLWIVAEDDEIRGADPAVARCCFELAGGDKTWLSIDGGHFGLLYHASERFDRASEAEAAFFARVL